MKEPMKEPKQKKFQTYQQTFKDQIARQIESWTHGGDAVTVDELFQFLHRIKGTGATIGLPLWSLQAETLLDELPEDGDLKWQAERWQRFLQPLLNLFETDDRVQHAHEMLPDISQAEVDPESIFVLLVSADALLVSMVKSQLEHIGWSVIAMDTAKRATRSFFRYRPDLILFDERQLLHASDYADQQYLLGKFDAAGIPRALFSSIKTSAMAEHWDALFDRSMQDDTWVGQCKRLLFRQHLWQNKAATRMGSVESFSRIWGKFKHWLADAVVLVHVDINRLREINERKGFAYGDQVIERLHDILREQFPEDVLYRGADDDFYLVVKSSEPGSVKASIEVVLRAHSSEVAATVRATILQLEDDIALVMRKLRDGNLAAASEPEAGTARRRAWSSPEKQTASRYYLGIIDDDEIVRKVLEEQFKSLPDVNIATYREGESFFQDDWHKQDGQYLLIVDGMLPRMDGFEVVYKIRNEYSHEKYAIIMLTARKSEKDIVRALELGVDDYVTKPFGIRELDARIRRLFKRIGS